MGNSCKSSTADEHQAVIRQDKKFVPKNCWDNQTVLKKTDNFDRAMGGRTWYLIANSLEKESPDAACKNDFFIENY